MDWSCSNSTSCKGRSRNVAQGTSLRSCAGGRATRALQQWTRSRRRSSPRSPLLMAAASRRDRWRLRSDPRSAAAERDCSGRQLSGPLPLALLPRVRVAGAPCTIARDRPPLPGSRASIQSPSASGGDVGRPLGSRHHRTRRDAMSCCSRRPRCVSASCLRDRRTSDPYASCSQQQRRRHCRRSLRPGAQRKRYRAHSESYDTPDTCRAIHMSGFRSQVREFNI